MSSKTKIREIDIVDKGGAFNAFFSKLTGERDYDFEGISLLRKLLSNQRARLLNTIKTKHPKSLYELAKLLNRDFKSVSEDIKLLERFGFVKMISEKTGNRERLRPILLADTITIHVKI